MELKGYTVTHIMNVTDLDDRTIEGSEKEGMTLDEAMKLTRDDVANELGGLPAIKKHCSNLAADALREAIKDYREKNKK